MPSIARTSSEAFAISFSVEGSSPVTAAANAVSGFEWVEGAGDAPGTCSRLLKTWMLRRPLLR